jgi:hypothetical protein
VLTGTPLDLTPFGPALSLFGLAYWLLAIGLLGLSLWWPKRWPVKLGAAGFVAVAFASPVLRHLGTGAPQTSQSADGLGPAMSRFEQRCKAAGEKITRTVSNVDGVVWKKWREKEPSKGDQFRLDDPYGRDCSDVECIERLLRVTHGAELNPAEAAQHAKGYRYIESIDPTDGHIYRYVGVVKLHPRWTQQAIAREKELTGRDLGPSAFSFTLERERIGAFTARYALSWDDISTRADRETWIAGGSIKVIDMQTDAIVAERAGFLIDTGQGSKAGFRDPWGWAWSYGPRCPRVYERTWDFAVRVLKPR